jgi:hypothetical protein
MVATPRPSFEDYYNSATAPTNSQQNDSRTLQYALIAGLVLTSALAAYFAASNWRLKNEVNKNSSKT